MNDRGDRGPRICEQEVWGNERKKGEDELRILEACAADAGGHAAGIRKGKDSSYLKMWG
jgi:hypothetical protein